MLSHTPTHTGGCMRVFMHTHMLRLVTCIHTHLLTHAYVRAHTHTRVTYVESVERPLTYGPQGITSPFGMCLSWTHTHAYIYVHHTCVTCTPHAILSYTPLAHSYT